MGFLGWGRATTKWSLSCQFEQDNVNWVDSSIPVIGFTETVPGSGILLVVTKTEDEAEIVLPKSSTRVADTVNV